ncbi:hypothetical protein ABEB36_005019 [Hypothenemus hampei]|uniref:CHK kinase-like domain-containing protein n=1 Tax=Hypothenemus hampei TaxID=57062 RepID=A0ABD1EWN6_HYPHA
MSSAEAKLRNLVEKALFSENLEKYELKFCGGTEKGEGYIGDITFVDVLGENRHGSKVEYSLVLKTGGQNKTLRPIVRLGFEREIHVYSKILPAFWNLQDEHLMKRFQSIPRCYLTMLSDHNEALVLENIKSLGFKLYDRKQVMTLDHIQAVLKVLGQWHALSFALKEKKPLLLEQLTCNWKCTAAAIFVNSHVGEWINLAQKYLIQTLEVQEELELLHKYKEKTRNQTATDIIKSILSIEKHQVVVTHGDCWNNNLMFKYQDFSLNVPSEVKILDFQIASISSPVIDLSYFIYAVSSEEQLQHFPQLLKTYYEALSACLQEIECVPDQIFSYSDLIRHWQNFSAYGAMVNPMVVCDNLVDKDDAVSYTNNNENYETIIQTVDQKQKKLFTSRIVAVAKHFVHCEFQ